MGKGILCNYHYKLSLIFVIIHYHYRVDYHVDFPVDLSIHERLINQNILGGFAFSRSAGVFRCIGARQVTMADPKRARSLEQYGVD